VKRFFSKYRLMLFIGISLATALPGFARASDLRLPVGQGKLYAIGEPALDILITDPDIADVQLTQGNSLFIYGKKAGNTHIVVLTEKDRILLDQKVEIVRDLAALEKVLRDEFPATRISLTSSKGRLVVGGVVSSPAMMDQALGIISGFLQKGEEIVNRLTLASPLQVNLKVRILEMNREAAKELGVNWNVLLNPGSLAVGLLTGRTPAVIGSSILPKDASRGGSALVGINGSSGSVSTVIDAMAEDNLITVLAEPNLTSRSGETASFFAGGEFPIPVAADDQKITIEFKKFGVILDMTPTVLSEGRIRLHIRPEVSELSTAGAITLQNISIPGISVRRTEATIELASGQSFSVAGLLQKRNRKLVRDIPLLADLDILGPLFRSRQYQNSETELVIIATANIVRPLNRDIYRSPISTFMAQDEYRIGHGSSLLKSGKGRELVTVRQKDTRTLTGPIGYIY